MQQPDLANDKDFMERFPLVWNRLEKFLLAEQREFARQNAGSPEKIGLYVEFMTRFMDQFDAIANKITIAEQKPRHKRLNTPAT